MNRYSFFIILLLVLSLVFAFQNTQAISIRFLAWSLDGSQALIIIITFFTGLVTGALLLANRLYVKNREVKRMRKEFLETGKVKEK